MANNKKRGGYGLNLTSGGTPFLIGFIALAIGFGVLFARGITPSSTLTDPGPQSGGYEMIPETPVPGQKGLQLKTLKFKECSQTAAVDMQLDITGSMGGTIGDLKNAVFTFTDGLSDSSIIGIQAYNSITPQLEVIPVSLYKDVKNQIHPAVNALQAEGSTPSYDAITFSQQIIQAAIQKYPGKKFSYIFFSDGNPNSGPDTPADIAQASQGIKNLGVTVYAIGLGSNGGINQDVLNAVASSPDEVYLAPTSDKLADIYKQIASRLCQ